MTSMLDTGSSVTWFPCTNHYNCSDCGNIDDDRNSTNFIPEHSTSARVLECTSPECQKFHVNNLFCNDCHESSKPNNCTQLCPYNIGYGIGSTSGFFLSETLHFSDAIQVKDFVVGCSTKASQMSVGIAGFGRKQIAMPAQLGAKMFSYCLVSHKFDDTSKTSQLIMVREGSDGGGYRSNDSQSGIVYTPFTRFQTVESYYYVTVTKITVGLVDIKVPNRYLVPGPDGNGGTIVDSGTTFTVMDDEIFQLVLAEYENQMGQYYPRADDLNIDNHANLTCYNVSGSNPGNYPELNFYFEGGAKMAVSISDSFDPNPDVVCLTLLSALILGDDQSGPSIILGNFLQQDIYFEYDLENQRLGFRKQIC
ncbi:OLC1v1034104C1 [Oldenlandia corymbosa var. corymbosa]|uniref:OLC1v1034104C1 n=1 Tax=Oldenlandia corymbosa var. corymbosa TaxID=529605 RepID=A0AAV1CSR3_OLDCO|nr:OLC1v1034104C1 [Oldenlandia corymbosa var. corymbosa]